ncbi:hypothetical protein [Duganella fentianensis]|uniref:RCC1 domain-containing protein n=1 Tax=Duganella fentianensis TaxID=2692177 RepID=UPI0032B19587
MKKFCKTYLLLPLLGVLAACGGGGGGSSTPAPATLKSIAVTAPSSTMPVGTTMQLTATGTYSDNSTKVLNTATGLVWAFKGTGAVASIFSSGSVTAKAVGSDTFTATQDGITGSINLSVIAPWANVVAGGYQTLARKADGSLYAWGSNIRGQLGDSTTIDRNAPVQVSGGSLLWKQIAVGEQFVVALRSDGTIWSWGFNQNGRLGDGTTVDHAIPTKIGKDTDWAYVAAGKGHAFAIKTTGVMYAWGRNFNGQLGDGTTIDRLVPTKLTSPTTGGWLAVSAGDTHTLAITKDTLNLYGWGGNANGQVGNGGQVDVTAPAKIGSSTWASVSAGGSHSLAVRADGSMYGWGYNLSGQVGNNGSASVNAPVQISTATNWAMVSAGAAHSMAVTREGQLWGWGSNAESQLGNGGPDISAPAQIGTASNWISVTAGNAHTFGLRSDNTLWGWGRNVEGQLGKGDNTQAPVPVSIP